MKKILLVGLLFLVSAGKVDAQWLFGVSESNWIGTNALYLNPALIADNREKFSVDIFSLNVVANNNLGTFGSVSDLVNRAFSGQSGNSVQNLFKYTATGNFSLLAPYVEVRGPGMLINIKQKHVLALTTRVRAINQFNHFNKTIYQIIADSVNVPANTLYPVTSKNFNWTAQMWDEIAMTYSTILLDQGRNRVQVGITGRYLGGIGYISFKGNNVDVYYNAKNDSISAVNTDFEYSSNLLNTRNAFTEGLNQANVLKTIFQPKNANGIGGDVGIVYEYRTNYEEKTYDMDGRTGIVDHSKNHYKFRISAAVTDLGHINYNSGTYSAYIKGNGSVTGQQVNSNANNFNSFMTYVNKKGFSADTSVTSAKLYLPTCALFSFDYHAARRTYINLTYVANLAFRSDFGNIGYDQLTLTPRYDLRNYSFGLPLSYNALSQDFKMGIGVRAYGFFVGSDDMLAFFAKNQYGFNFYFGGHIPINNKIPRDRDGDGVSDKKDRCPDEPGTWENHGCPESDEENGGSPDDNPVYEQ